VALSSASLFSARNFPGLSDCRSRHEQKNNRESSRHDCQLHNRGLRTRGSTPDLQDCGQRRKPFFVSLLLASGPAVMWMEYGPCCISFQPLISCNGFDGSVGVNMPVQDQPTHPSGTGIKYGRESVCSAKYSGRHATANRQCFPSNTPMEGFTNTRCLFYKNVRGHQPVG